MSNDRAMKVFPPAHVCIDCDFAINRTDGEKREQYTVCTIDLGEVPYLLSCSKKEHRASMGTTEPA
jgi:hypothetical protein